ncbi:hypothetical protein L1887_14801 [Cichorium endivia]|nr:hypothetical protein L1887_14801 [Cichorium endivia]
MDADDIMEAVKLEAVDLETIPIEEVYENLRCFKDGLSSEDAEKRLEIFGYNKLEEKTVNCLLLSRLAITLLPLYDFGLIETWKSLFSGEQVLEVFRVYVKSPVIALANRRIIVPIYNYQLYRHIEPPRWKLIWDMRGAEATEQGNCSAYLGKPQLPHSWEREPAIIDLLPGTPYNMQVQNCCKGGVLS